eukprot:gnl/TRDRNA2_/TRDRNA2_168225_c0_seq2.p2 gnl/TRDRNA2_/TRDRNA2_168225_c0~~gnl/TRDRNA2_/TRDRNA2_168225_c0_seq2.p2  ORF type:complete len:118 (+),score=7.55 gnl/TRDRNA2_/TRDRNA2_168225_c0_seq2:671-1024(+)
MVGFQGGEAHGRGVRWRRGCAPESALLLVDGKLTEPASSVDDPVATCLGLGFPRQQVPPMPKHTTTMFTHRCFEMLLQLCMVMAIMYRNISGRILAGFLVIARKSSNQCGCTKSQRM